MRPEPNPRRSRAGKLGAFAAAALGTVMTIALAGCRRAPAALPNPNPIAGEPRVVLWAWERPADLRFIDPRTTGVSVLVESIWLAGQGIGVEPNLNRVRFPSGTWLMACARIEIERGVPPALSGAQAEAVAAELAGMTHIPRMRALQIDFDATRAQRGFYRRLLKALRRRLPPGYPVSITALASWCGGDDWLRGLAVQEAVPMLFRMGPDQSFRGFVERGGRFREPLCESSAGLSDDEAFPVPGQRRLYLFAAHGWSPEVYRAMMATIRR